MILDCRVQSPTKEGLTFFLKAPEEDVPENWGYLRYMAERVGTDWVWKLQRCWLEDTSAESESESDSEAEGSVEGDVLQAQSEDDPMHEWRRKILWNSYHGRVPIFVWTFKPDQPKPALPSVADPPSAVNPPSAVDPPSVADRPSAANPPNAANPPSVSNRPAPQTSTNNGKRRFTSRIWEHGRPIPHDLPQYWKCDHCE